MKAVLSKKLENKICSINEKHAYWLSALWTSLFVWLTLSLSLSLFLSLSLRYLNCQLLMYIN